MESLSQALSSPEMGEYGKQLSNNLYGFNHRNAGSTINTLVRGRNLVFFTRPHFNMRKNNLRNDRVTTNLVTKNNNNIHSYIRQTLDPSLAKNEKFTCSLLDNENGFIPLLSNTLKSISGWPDRVLPTFASKPGARGEQFSIPDGIIEINGKIDLTLTFDKMDGNINEKLLEMWMYMMSLQVDGIVVPYAAFEGYTERNFDTRIYVLNMDITNRIVLGIGIANAGFPVNDNIGRNFDTNKNVQNTDPEFSIRFEMNGISYNDPILIYEFNLVSGLFNQDVFNLLTGSSHNLTKIDQNELYKYNYRGYPIIDIQTMELNWWV